MPRSLRTTFARSGSSGFDPIPNMTELLEEKGLKVLTIELPERVSGVTCLVQRPSDSPHFPVIVVNNRFTLERRRLTLAHELAHRLIDTDSLTDKDEEKAATLFGGAFLMPAEHLRREVGRIATPLGTRRSSISAPLSRERRCSADASAAA